MEPLSDEQLDWLLATWVAPAVPADIEQRLFATKRHWWERLFSKIELVNARARIRRRLRRKKGMV